MQKKKKVNIEWDKVEAFGIIICILLMAYFIGNFWRGIHNIDLVYNMNNVAAAINAAGLHSDQDNNSITLNPGQLTDKGNDFQDRPLSDYYIAGMNQITKAFFEILITALILGLLLGRKFDSKNNINRN